jgi:hypothetical protein
MWHYYFVSRFFAGQKDWSVSDFTGGAQRVLGEERLADFVQHSGPREGVNILRSPRERSSAARILILYYSVLWIFIGLVRIRLQIQLFTSRGILIRMRIQGVKTNADLCGSGF